MDDMGIRAMVRRRWGRDTLPTAIRGHDGQFSGAPRRRPPHVAIIVENLPLRLDRRVRHECQALIRAGYAVSVICPKEEPGEVDEHVLDGVHVYSYRAFESTGGVLSYFWEFATCFAHTSLLTLRIHRTRPFDVLQACNPPDTYWLLGAFWRLMGRPFVFDQHDLCPEVYQARFRQDGLVYSALLWNERQTYRTADRVISPNPGYREVALDRGRIPPHLATVVMSTPDPKLMKRGGQHPTLRRSRKHLICYVGIMGPQDGVDNLLVAIDCFVHHLGRRDTHFALLGFGDSAAALRDDCTSRGLDPWVTFTGRVDHEEISRWLSTADIGVTPDPPNEFNHRSTMNKTLEYMAHEVPVVAVDLRETRRCADDAAVYVSGTDRLEAAQAMSDLLDDPVRREHMGRRGRARIEGELAWRTQAREYVQVFDALTTTGRQPSR
ncbi:glycosyltransferase family 4 protein [Janibacter cremeus]|uniref:D-inositol 3-phosphate glycosyltransferase n=1 Tax=Janibacter cremeus TaxID=1285192 RepID=A0A852VWJ5_9MICO|nr:glycosyltransferase family 4 protein [Janibacter cremeus]NYF99023.1 glycosyltransferase involved in cell wall biosynthesis [Janibacter cremeus]